MGRSLNLLLDTHVVLWALTDDQTLSPHGRAALVDNRNRVVVSAAAVWEIAIKRALGKLDAPDDLIHTLAATGFDALPISLEHAAAAGALPRHHRDPFDRMLVAQARLEGLALMTRDSRMARYDVEVVSA